MHSCQNDIKYYTTTKHRQFPEIAGSCESGWSCLLPQLGSSMIQMFKDSRLHMQPSARWCGEDNSTVWSRVTVSKSRQSECCKIPVVAPPPLPSPITRLLKRCKSVWQQSSQYCCRFLLKLKFVKSLESLSCGHWRLYKLSQLFSRKWKVVGSHLDRSRLWRSYTSCLSQTLALHAADRIASVVWMPPPSCSYNCRGRQFRTCNMRIIMMFPIQCHAILPSESLKGNCLFPRPESS